MAEHTKLMEVAKAVGCDLMLLACGNRKQTTERKAELNKLIPAIKNRDIVPLWILEFGKDQVKGAVQESSISQATLTKWVQELKGEDYVAPVTKPRKASVVSPVQPVAVMKQVTEAEYDVLQLFKQRNPHQFNSLMMEVQETAIQKVQDEVEAQIKAMQEKLMNEAMAKRGIVFAPTEEQKQPEPVNPAALPEVKKETEKAFLTRVKAEIEQASFNGLNDDDAKHLADLEEVNPLAKDLLKRLDKWKKTQETDEQFLDRLDSSSTDPDYKPTAKDSQRLEELKGKGGDFEERVSALMDLFTSPLQEALQDPTSDSKE